jgi:hypothetical protein
VSVSPRKYSPADVKDPRISSSSGDQSTISTNVKVVSAPQTSHFMVPYQRNPHFIGRDEQLNQLRIILCDAKPKQRIALYGLGGIGKTQLAIEIPITGYIGSAAWKKHPCSRDSKILPK